MPRTGSTTPDETPACIGSMTEPDVLLLPACVESSLLSYSIRRGLRAHESGEIMVYVLLLVEARGARSSLNRDGPNATYGRLSLSDLIGRLAGRSSPNVTLQRLAERATG